MRAISIAAAALAGAILSASIAASAASPFPVTPDLQPTPLLPATEVFYDESGSLDLEGARALAAEGRFRPAPDSFALGHAEGALWARFVLENPGNAEASLVLDIDFPQLDHVTLYTSAAGGPWTAQSQGDARPFADRLVPVHSFLFPLDVPARSSTLGFVRVQSTSVLSLPMELSSANAYWGAVQDRSLLTGCFYGVLLGLLAYNLFLYVSSRERAYFFYSSGSFFFMLYFAQHDGLMSRLWEGVAPWQHYGVFVFVFLGSASFLQFTRDYLELRRYAPRLDLAHRVLTLTTISFAAAGPFVSLATLEALGSILAVSVVLAPATAVVRLRQGFRPALPYLVAWAPYLAGAMFVITSALGLVPGFNDSVVAFQATVASERILMSFALASRLKMIREHEYELERQTLEARTETLAERRRHELTEQTLRDREEQLRHSQKMDTVGQLTGGVAHDFNNLLTVIQGYGQTLHDELQDDRDLVEMTDEILHVSQRAADLTRRLLSFSRRQPAEPQVVELNEIVGGLEKMLGRLLGETISLELELSPGLPSVEIDPGQLEQVVVNLAVNARDAMPRGGRLRLQTMPLEAEGPDGEPATFVGLRVVDEGEGMAPETQERIFEPFFTTKGPGRGTGLGLSTAYGIVTQAGGHCRVQSELGRGTTIEVLLPAREGDPV